MRQPMVNIAVRAARYASNIMLRYLNRLDRLSIAEKQRHDFVTEVDQAAEKEIVRTIRKVYPDHTILAEESGRSGSHDTEWIIDPLDGTTNFLHGIPHFAISIAVRQKGLIEHAVIYDPVKEELYTASRGNGAFLNDKRIRVNDRKGVNGSLLATGFPFRRREYLEPYLEMFKALFRDAADVRRAGSAALDLAYIAAGRLDGFWEIGLQPWDTAAGALLVREAGGTVLDFAGGEQYMTSGNVIAGNIKVAHELQDMITPYRPEGLKR